MAEAVFMTSIAAFLAIVLLFNALYFFVVLPRLTSSRVALGGDMFVTFRQQRYVKAYLDLLTEEEKRRWFNVVIRHSIPASLAVGAAGFLSTFFLGR